MDSRPKHSSHPSIVARLKRAGGHLESIVTMIEESRSCLDLAQQLHAVEKAVRNAKREMIHDHIEHCLEDGTDLKSSLAELKQLAKYL
ncbi:MAG: metal-sensing transcriptional repressor [Vulcanimicrobiaceae bacterium]